MSKKKVIIKRSQEESEGRFKRKIKMTENKEKDYVQKAMNTDFVDADVDDAPTGDSIPDFNELPDMQEAAEAAEKYGVIEDEKVGKTSVRMGFVGGGQGGSNLCDTFWKLGYRRVLVMNTAAQDMGSLVCDTKNQYVLEGFDGAGKKPSVGKQAFEKHYENVLRHFHKCLGKNVDRIMLCIGAGGGCVEGGTRVFTKEHGLIPISKLFKILSEQSKTAIIHKDTRVILDESNNPPEVVNARQVIADVLISVKDIELKDFGTINVLTANKQGINQWKNITSIWKNSDKGDGVRITTDTGSIISSQIHPYFIYDINSESLITKKAAELVVGDLLFKYVPFFEGKDWEISKTLSPITEIGEVKHPEFYDLTVEDNESYFAGEGDLFLVHNTGTGGCEILINVAKDFFKEIGKDPCIGIIATCPEKTEKGAVKQNAGILINRLLERVKIGEISPLILVDNDKIAQFFPNESISNFYPKSNQIVCGIFDRFNTITAYASPIGHNVDGADYKELLAGGLMTYGQCRIDNIKDDTSLAEAMIKNIKNTLLSPNFDLSAATNATCLIVASAEQLNKITKDAVNKAIESLSRVFTNPNVKIHLGIYKAPVKGISICTAVSGAVGAV